MHRKHVFLHVLSCLAHKVQRVGVWVWLRHVCILYWLLLLLALLLGSSLFGLFLLLLVFTWRRRHQFTKLDSHGCFLLGVNLSSDLLNLWLPRYLRARLLNNVKYLVQINLELSLPLCSLLQEVLKLFFLLVQTQLIVALLSIFIDLEASVLILFTVLISFPNSSFNILLTFFRVDKGLFFQIIIESFERPLLLRNLFEVELLDEEILNLFVVCARRVTTLDCNYPEKNNELVEQQAWLALLWEDLALFRVLVLVIDLEKSFLLDHVDVLLVCHWGEHPLAEQLVETFDVLYLRN